MAVCPHGSMWLSLSVLLLLLQGLSGQITVTQSPSVVVSQLHGNATLACRFSHTPDQGVTGVILYWYYVGPNEEDLYVYPPSQAPPEYEGRVVALDSSVTSEVKSVVMLRASWTDRHTYHCLLSYEIPGDAERKRGTGVLLLLYDSMTFDLAPGMVSNLLCSVKVSPDSGFRLSVLQEGAEVLSVQNHTHSPHVTLSLHVPILHGVQYECRLKHSSDLIQSQTYYIPRESGFSTELPEPVFLYAAIILIPFIVFVIFLTALFIMRRRCRGGRGYSERSSKPEQRAEGVPRPSEETGFALTVAMTTLRLLLASVLACGLRGEWSPRASTAAPRLWLAPAEPEPPDLYHVTD
ncbi:hypothetical protein SKAU_G00417200 [Synaphobranchus kaupii]|uniref:Ig-like domain-containing protein n=1 Tax=Synaphobranchus kaupii TaxID=118154 RepID=A0A9Q1E5Z3_SYNKA|nr:hypothetical protein SKAU_G00417200 [Synaphobranchus kaupii]